MEISEGQFLEALDKKFRETVRQFCSFGDECDLREVRVIGCVNPNDPQSLGVLSAIKCFEICPIDEGTANILFKLASTETIREFELEDEIDLL